MIERASAHLIFVNEATVGLYPPGGATIWFHK